MKALLLKDFLAMKSQLKMIVSILLLFVVVSFFLQDSFYLILSIFIFGTIQVTTSFTYDEMSNWDQYANTLPLEESEIVKSKYVLSLLLSIGTLLLFSPILLLINHLTKGLPLFDLLPIIALLATGSLMIMSLLLPIYIKFGTQKGRLFLFLIVILPIIGFNASISFILDQLPPIETIQKLSYVSPIFGAILFILSYILSVKLYETKEF